MSTYDRTRTVPRRPAGTNVANAARVAFPKAPNGMIRIAPCESLVTVTVQRRQSNGG